MGARSDPLGVAGSGAGASGKLPECLILEGNVPFPEGNAGAQFAKVRQFSSLNSIQIVLVGASTLYFIFPAIFF